MHRSSSSSANGNSSGNSTSGCSSKYNRSNVVVAALTVQYDQVLAVRRVLLLLVRLRLRRLVAAVVLV
jgi:hypothetical protein